VRPTYPAAEMQLGPDTAEEPPTLSLSLSLSLNAPSVLFSHQLHCLLSLSLSLSVCVRSLIEINSFTVPTPVYCIFKFMGKDSDSTVQLQLWRRMPCFPSQRSVPIFQLLPCFFPFICLDMVKASFSCFFSLFYLALAFPSWFNSWLDGGNKQTDTKILK
jgi:hypothetical protein